MRTKQTIHGLFEGQAKNRAHSTAVEFGQQGISYGELNSKANQLAHYLLAKGVKINTQVALCMERSIDLLIAMLAILKAGAGYVPLDPSHPEKRLNFLLADNDNPLLITTANYQQKFSDYRDKLILLEREEEKIINYPQTNLNLPINSKNLAYITYTSGSTGTPKGVLIEHKSLINYCLWFADFCDCLPGQRIDFSNNYIFDLAVTNSIVPLMLGLTVIIADEKTKKDPQRYLHYLKENQLNIIKTTPSYFRVLIDEVKNQPLDLPQLQSIVLGGESLRTVDCEAWFTSYPNTILINEYGPTEATVGVTLYRIFPTSINLLDKEIPIGYPGPGIDFYILDKKGASVAEGEIGELYIGGECLARGYLNQPQMTEEKFVNNPFKDKKSRLYKTGDLCRYSPTHGFEYVGRIDQQIKIRGFRIELGEIERCLMEYAGIKNAVVLARENKAHEKWIVAYYILVDSGNKLTVEEIRRHLSAYLPAYMIPTAFVNVEHFPLTANGKLDQFALPAPQFSPSEQYLPPRTPLEKMLCEIWSEELEFEPIGIRDNFFALGGHSLSAARIVSKIKNSLGKAINLSDFYKEPTIFSLAKLLKNTKKSIKFNRRQKLNTEMLPLSDFQFMLWISNLFESKVKKLNIVARKRLQGHINIPALNFAIAAVLSKQEILFYRVMKFRPVQSLQKNCSLKLIEKDLTSLTKQESERELLASMEELSHYYPWPRDLPLIRMRLYYLRNKIVELQVAMPHIIADNSSPEIFFADLSQFYFLHKNQLTMEQLAPYKQYKSHLLEEQKAVHEGLDKKMRFWENYLKNTSLLPVPVSKIEKQIDFQKFIYSTYQEISDQVLNSLQQFSAKNQLAMSDVLCGALALALVNCCAQTIDTRKALSMNLVRSTRDNEVYDETIGCFLRIEPIKLRLSRNLTLPSLAEEVRHAKIDTSHYQECPGIIKLACLSPQTKKRCLKNFLLRSFLAMYSKLVPEFRFNHQMFPFYERLASFKPGNQFLINVNIWNNFVQESKTNANLGLFGLKSQSIAPYQVDLLKVNNVLDVCFLRDPNQNSPYIVISGNLKPAFRKKLAKEMIKIIQHESQFLEKVIS